MSFPHAYSDLKNLSLSFGSQCTTCNWWEAVRVIKYRYSIYMDPAVISVPKVHLKAATLKHVLQIRREDNSWFHLTPVIQHSTLAPRYKENRDPRVQRPSHLPLHRSARSTITLSLNLYLNIQMDGEFAWEQANLLGFKCKLGGKSLFLHSACLWCNRITAIKD